MTAQPPTAETRRGVFGRVLTTLGRHLRQGITPHEIALTLALGLVVGILPVLGVSTALCIVIGLWLGLNQPILQLANYLAYPLQLALLLPFFRGGEWLFGQQPLGLHSVSALVDRFQAAPLQFMIDFGEITVYGVAVWLLLAPLLATALYLMTRPLLQRMAQRQARATA